MEICCVEVVDAQVISEQAFLVSMNRKTVTWRWL
tara:strand:+ start:157 stop:258 length:102 start_codon:yes stop_codon:yes gene_type:complete